MLVGEGPQYLGSLVGWSMLWLMLPTLAFMVANDNRRRPRRWIDPMFRDLFPELVGGGR